MFWLLVAGQASAVDTLELSYVLSQGAPRWTLDGGELSLPSITAGRYSAVAVEPRDIGLRGPRQARPDVDRIAAVPLLIAGDQVCHAAVVVATDGVTASVGVEGCDLPFATAVSEALTDWTWAKNDPVQREVVVTYSLRDHWWTDVGCVAPFRLYGSGAPVIAGRGTKECRIVTSQDEVGLRGFDGMPSEARCLATFTVAGAGTVHPPTITGCPEVWATAFAEVLDTWTFKPHGGEPTPYHVLLDIVPVL